MIFACFFYSILCAFSYQMDNGSNEYLPDSKTIVFENRQDQSLVSNLLDVSNIPLELLEDAEAVVRYEHVVCNILSKGKLETVVNRAVTVMTEKGIRAGDVSIYYNGETDEIKDLKIEILDANGDRITKIKKKEIKDVSQYDGFSIANDARRKVYRHVSNSFPYTVLFSYKIKSPNTLSIPTWVPVERMGVSVELNTYKINSSVPNLTIMQKAYNIEQYDIEIDAQKKSFLAKNIKAIKSEKKSPGYYKQLPFVRFSPTSFQHFEFEGAYTDWKSYGKWMYDNMLTGRGELPPALIAEMEQKLTPELSNEEKAKIIYDHVTNSTRYVSVQLGIGGWMPFRCSDVYDLKYGDCKALSYYTQNLMQHFGVEAIYTEIRSDRNYNFDYDTELPGVGQGNHIILCLPNEGDTIWLECTSKNVPFGYIHSSINGRKALLIKEDGGEIITTATYTAKENVSVRNISLRLEDNDELLIDFRNEHRSLRHENIRHGLLDVKKSKRDKYLKEYYYNQLASLEIESYQLEMDDELATLHERGTFKSKNHIEKAGSYKMIPLYVFSFNIPDKLKIDRSFPIYVKDFKSDSIRITMEIPEGMTYVLDKTPTQIFENEYGKTSSSIQYDKEKNSVNIELFFQSNAGTFIPESVANYNEFVQNIRGLINQKLILKPTE